MRTRSNGARRARGALAGGPSALPEAAKVAPFYLDILVEGLMAGKDAGQTGAHK